MIEVEVTIREKNQLTLPERVARRLGVRAGQRLIVTVADEGATEATMRPLRESYAGIAKGVYGRTTAEQLRYVAEERGSWVNDASPGAASDGTPYLSFEGSRRVYGQTEVTRERYDREPKLRWSKCERCGRSIARMREHAAAHRSGRLAASGTRTDELQRRRSSARVAKWRAAIARRDRRSR